MSVTQRLDDLPEIVYHYTNSAGVLGILTSRALRLGDVEFMNDAEELVFARATVISDLEARAQDLWPAGVEDKEQSENWARAQIIRGVVDELQHGLDVSARTYHAYATCFCERPDLLSQWRGYAGEGGYALGFRTSQLNELATSAETRGAGEFGRFVKVRYGLDDARGILADVVGKVAPYAKAHMGVEAWHEFMYNVLPLVATIKHPAFVEEQEWRLLVLSYGLSDSVAFRTSRIGLVPYTTLAFPDNAIASVVVGPGYYPDVRRTGMTQLVGSLGLENVEVQASAAPLRQ